MASAKAANMIGKIRSPLAGLTSNPKPSLRPKVVVPSIAGTAPGHAPIRSPMETIKGGQKAR